MAPTETTKRGSPTADAVRAAARSYKSAQQLARELGTSTRTIQRRIAELEAKGRKVERRSSWDGEWSSAPYYRIR